MRPTARDHPRVAAVLIHEWDAAIDDDEWRSFVATHGFGDLVAGGRDRDLPVVVPTQFVLEGEQVILHLVRTNPIWSAIEENPNVLLCVAGDWAFIPSSWKVIGEEDPRLGHPDDLLRGRADLGPSHGASRAGRHRRRAARAAG